jgi:hypothetical protein
MVNVNTKGGNVIKNPPVHAQLIEAAKDADTAFAVIGLNHEQLTPQAKEALIKGWRNIQDALAAINPDGAYAEAVRLSRRDPSNLLAWGPKT